MNPLIQLKRTSSVFVAAFALACFGLSPSAQAVSPAPDGCYPNFTTAEGCDALSFLTTGAGNTGLGWRSLFFDSTGNFNTGVGAGALALNNGDSNSAVGAAALFLNTSGTENTATGTNALVNNTTGTGNTANGAFALTNNTTGSDNTAVGVAALVNNTGSFNIALGNIAGSEVTTGNANIDIGNIGLATDAETIRIGDSQTATYIAGISGATVAGGVTVIVDANGHLGTIVSSQRFKDRIKPMDDASKVLFALRPVTFHYKTDTTETPQFGLIAEEVATVHPALVLPDKQGKPYTVRYDAVNAMLLNEFLKEHRKVLELEANAVRQQKQIDALTAGLQKVNAQRELTKSAPRTVLNNQ